MTGMIRITRRRTLKMGAAALLAAGLWPGSLLAGDAAADGDFTFIVVNDLHYFDDQCGPFFQKAIRQMKQTEGGPEFCLVAGDLAEDGKPSQLAAARDLLRELKIPVHVVVGNHDYLPAGDRVAYEDLFPRSLNYSFEHRNWQFIGLDTTQGRQGSKTTIQKPTFDWLRDHLPALDRNKQTVVFTHFPLGWLLPSVPRNAEDFLDQFKNLNLKAIFSGHFHSTTVRHHQEAVLTTNRCCSFHHANHDGTKEKGYFVCRVKDGKLSREFVEVKLG